MTIRFKILAGCLALTTLTGLLGLHVQHTEGELGKLAPRVYDEAFIGVSHLRSAQAGFATLASGRSAGSDAEALAAVIDDLNVAWQRAISPVGRTAAEGLSIAVGAVSAHPDPDIYLALQDAFECAVAAFASDGYREGIGRMVAARQPETTGVLGLTLLGALVITVVLTRLIAPFVRHAARVAQAIAAGRPDNPGVETLAQLDALRLEGCGELQGYLFSKPRPGAEVPDMLRQHGNAKLIRAEGAGRLAPTLGMDVEAAC